MPYNRVGNNTFAYIQDILWSRRVCKFKRLSKDNFIRFSRHLYHDATI